MKALILDDEAGGREDLRQLLAAHDDVEVVAEAEDVDAALKMTRERRPDVAFLDVRLRGETAFDYVGQLGEEKPRIVFVTAYDTYAVRGFECNALDFLLKPVLAMRLSETLDRIRNHVALQRTAPNSGDSVFLRFGQTAVLVPWREITHISSRGNYTEVYRTDRSCALILRPLKDWFILFPPDMFVRAHRTVIVRIKSIRKVDFSLDRQRILTLETGDTVPVGRSCWAEVKAALIKWHPEAGHCLA